MKSNADKQLIFFETVDKELIGLTWPLDSSRTLYVGIRNTGDLFWYDNEHAEWQKSMWSLGYIVDDPEFKKVTRFNNGYININDAKTYFMSKPHLLGEETGLSV